MNLKHKTFIVTGATSGMGYATTRTLVAEDANVAICDLDGELLRKVAQELDPESKVVLAKMVDVTDREEIRALIKDTKDKFGSIDGVASYAGVAGHELGTRHIWDISDKEYEFVMNVNVRGCFCVLSECLRPGVLGFRKGAIYSSSKHVVLGMVRSAAKDAGSRVRVNIVLPGAIDTPMHQANLQRIPDFVPAPSTPIPRDGRAQEVADVTIFLLSDKSTFVTGAAWSVDGGANA